MGAGVRPMTGNWPLPTGYVTRLDGSRAGWLGVFAPATEWEQDAAQSEMGRTVWPGSLMVEWRSGNERDAERCWEWPGDLGVIERCG